MFQELSTARTRPKLKKIKMGVPANQKSDLTMQKLENENFDREIHRCKLINTTKNINFQSRRIYNFRKF